MRRATVATVAVALLAAACNDDDDSAETTSSPTDSVTVPPNTSGTAVATTAVTTTPASVIEDTRAVGGTSLYSVDLRTGAAEALGTVGVEVGVLGLTAIGDELLGLTDVPDLVSFGRDDPTPVGAPVPITGVEGSTLLALDSAVDGTLFAIGDAGALVTIDRVTGVATPVAGGTVPVADPGIGLDVDASSGELVVTDAVGTHQLVDQRTATVTPLPALAYADGDPNAGVAPRIVAVAVAGDSSRFAVDAGTASLVQLGADGVLTTIGPLGVDITDGASFDIAFDGQARLTSPG